MYTFDKRTVDAAGVFLLGELERLDKTLHMPLSVVTWGRDIDLRTDVSLADEVSSFTNTSFGAPGSTDSEISWASELDTATPGIALTTEKTNHSMRLWSRGLSYFIRELAAAQQVGRPVDSQKHEAIKLEHQMDIDRMVYVGDPTVRATGLLNCPDVTPDSVTKAWASATPLQILDSINAVLDSAWIKSGYALMPTHLLCRPRPCPN